MSLPKRIVGTGTKSCFQNRVPCTQTSSAEFCGISIERDDLIFTVGSGVTICELQSALLAAGLWLPMPDPAEYGILVAGFPGTVGGLIASNLPHGLSHQFGGPSSWLLHCEVEFDGEGAVSGAKVVKSVAGYDVHKLFIGSWGKLGMIRIATFRAWPIGAKTQCESQILSSTVPESIWIARTLQTEFESYKEKSTGLLAYDQPSSTLWLAAEPELPKEGWVLGPCGSLWSDNLHPELTRRIKQRFDPVDQWV